MKLNKGLVIALIFVIILGLSNIPVYAEVEKREWQDEIIYFIMVDRFNNGDRSNDFHVNTQDPLAYHGGDFKGIIEKLDYIKEMGFTAIWLTPIFDNSAKGYHGYWIVDFYNTEEHFGTLEEFKKLVEEAHKRDIKIILDFVVNHTSPEHPWLKDPDKTDWFHEEMEILNWEDPEQLENGWIYGLPDLAQENPEVKDYLIENAKWWIQETDIDGFRLDTVKHVPESFWKEFSQEVKAVKEDFYLLGEVLVSHPAHIVNYLEAGIDGAVDYPLYYTMRDTFSEPDRSLAAVFQSLERNEIVYERPDLMGTFIDNHDTPRFTYDVTTKKYHPIPRWQLALTFMYTTPGIPIIYYGTEIALNGAGDPDNRRLMEFIQSDLVDYISKLGSIRSQHKSLTRGSLEVLYEERGMTIYKREYEDEITVVALNNTSKNQTVQIPEEAIAMNKTLSGLLDDNVIQVESGYYTFMVKPESSEIFLVKDPSGINVTAILISILIPSLFVLYVFIVWKKGKRHKKI